MSRRTMATTPRTAVIAGTVFLFAGTMLIWSAYEGRGRPRPFLARLITIV